MAIKKTELYSSLWASCDELRGGMDASQYKDFVLTLLFMKYVLDKYKGDPYGMIVVPEGASFDDMLALKVDKEIGDKVKKIISALAEENDLKGVIDLADFNDEDKLGKGKDMVDRLTKLIGTFDGLDMSANRADGDDLLGDAYEYLMRHFATESGKSKGQFYTPSEVSRILSKVIGINEETQQDETVYDPTCGSGSLLLKASDEAPRGLSIFGQENEGPTAALARMNMILHNNATAKIWKGNTISDPQWKDGNVQLKTFDFAVANPPFSNKNWTSGITPDEDEFKRFEWGIPPEKNGDYTFLLHIIKSLNSHGKGAVILPHGVLFRGNAEARIRENLIKQGYIKAIIGLPANLFYGTGIPACIIVIDKQSAAHRSGIFMVDASKGFMKDGNKNRLRSQDIHKIVDVFTKQLELPRLSRTVPLSEIVSNDYNLNIPRYIDASEPEDLHDLSAHLQGGIPQRDIDALEHYWQVFPSIRATLFAPLEDSKRRGYSKGLVEASQVKRTILNHPEFISFAALSLEPFTAWAERAALPDIEIGEAPKAIIQRFYAEEQAAVDELQAALDTATQALESYIEENSGEDGSLRDALNDKDKVTKASVTAQLKKAVEKEELAALKHVKKLFDAEAKAKKTLKDAKDALLLSVFKHYLTLSEDDIKTLIVDGKWLATLNANVQAEIERVTQQLAKRVKELEERYAEPLPAIEESVALLSNKVAEHLKVMGLSI